MEETTTQQSNITNIGPGGENTEAVAPSAPADDAGDNAAAPQQAAEEITEAPAAPILVKTGDPKYAILGEGRICNAATGEPIPADEPIMILRAKDRMAYMALDRYYRLALARCDGAHCESVAERMQAFQRFSDDHPDRMKIPDTTVPEPANTEGLAVEAEGQKLDEPLTAD